MQLPDGYVPPALTVIIPRYDVAIVAQIVNGQDDV